MANTCTNLVYAELQTENNVKYFEKWLEKNFEFYDVDRVDVYAYDVEIDSRWTFPEEEFADLTNNLPDKVDNIYIRCLSYELGCYYHALWLYENNEWTPL